MTDQMQAIQDDIRYMRALADEGRRAPLLGGPILLMAGLTFGAASLSAWAFQNRLLSLDPAWQNAVWASSFIAFLTTLKLLMRGQSKKVGRAPSTTAPPGSSGV